MKLLITGGLGFIGSNFIRHILNKYSKYKIVNLDKMTYAGNPENLRDIEGNPRYKFIRGDICDGKLVNELTSEEKLDAIINFAAESHVDRSILNPDISMNTNILGTHVLLEAVKKCNIEKFIQISTDEVYGSIEKGEFTERSPIQPNSPYSASKASADLIVQSYFKTYNLPVLITRSSNDYGPYQHPEKLIPLFITNLLESKKLSLHGDGLPIRDWLHVLDNCEAIDLVLHKGEFGEVYNIGANNEKTNEEIARIILEEFGKDNGWIEYIKDRPGQDRRYAQDSTKIKKLGWEPRRDFKEAIKETIVWYEKNQEWWQGLK